MRTSMPLALAFALLAAFDQGIAAPPAASPQIVAKDECVPDGPAGEITVCGERKPSPYRLPPEDQRFNPWGDIESVARERAALMEGGESGIHSCSNIGPGGWTGCDLKAIKRGEQQGKRVGIGARASAGIQIGRVVAGTGGIGRAGQ